MATGDTGGWVRKTASGRVAGIGAGEGVGAWLGIPFAAAPVGGRRWRAPQAAPAWSGVRDCDRYGAACVQPSMPQDAIMRQFSFDTPAECGMDEDCLSLNVWSAGTAGDALPVIVFLYGGGHRVGSASHRVSRGKVLARKGAVVVTLNYRLGALGYLAHPALTAEEGASGNYACLDVIAALRWVRENISNFGGDPGCVTLFGQSAGGALVNVLMASPLARGLFHRAIVHSSGRFETGTGPVLKMLAQAEQTGLELCDRLEARNAPALRALPPGAIEGPRGWWGPIVEGRVLDEQPHAVFRKGEQHDVPLLVGYTHDEASPYPMHDQWSVDGFAHHVRKTFGLHAKEVLSLFPVASDEEAVLASYALRRDTTFAYQAWKMASLHAATANSPVYLFNFMRAVPFPSSRRFHEPRPPGGYGAYHGSELWYAFGTFEALEAEWHAGDRALSEAMSSAWVAFARTGKPAASELPDWPAWRQSGDVMLLDTRCHVGHPFNEAALELFERIWSG